MKSVFGGPLLFRFAKRMGRSHVRGGSFLMRCFDGLGALNVVAQYQLGRVKFGVSLYRVPWDSWDVESYEAELIAAFCRAVGPLKDVILFDCGADIGTFSALVASR